MSLPILAPEDRPLAGLKVLDFAQFLAGPAAALRLADLGATVIKIERPKGGDLCRGLVINDQKLDDSSLLFHTFNRGKQSVAADLKNPADLAAVKRLVAEADVMIHNFRPGVMDRIGLDIETVRAVNPGIVYGHVTGYGNDGPWRDKPGQDLLAQSLSGMCWLQGDRAQGPVPVGFALLDIATGNNLVQGILSMLVRRGVSGQGGLVEVDLMSSAMDLQFEQLTAFFNDDTLPSRTEISNANVYGAAPYGIYATADGWLALAMVPLAVLADLLDCPALNDFAQPEAFGRRDEIKPIIAAALKTRPTQAWLDVLEPADVWCAEVLDWARLSRTEGFAALSPLMTMRTADGREARTTRCPIRLDGGLLTSGVGAPALGAHTSQHIDKADAV
ncbi:CaiB/BaiF CoA-transferase family protein [Jannaschia sp. M317]|uniref:CaiB/BaiF CoA transferase family protein n=1 Tax=Jannaschia sp. M317 TaxID=2867011 RepID=UPI0021A6E3F5|nr:CoA transferase [Jannaschia sp. M317]UWQ19889.1 CoA transferase [Jannaschia sp. M317]